MSRGARKLPTDGTPMSRRALGDVLLVELDGREQIVRLCASVAGGWMVRWWDPTDGKTIGDPFIVDADTNVLETIEPYAPPRARRADHDQEIDPLTR